MGIVKEERIGGHRLILGDCLEVMPHLGKVDAVVTDPPYGVNLTAKCTKHSKITASHNYADTPEHVLPMVTEAIRLAMALAPCALVTPGNRLLQDYPKATSIVFFTSALVRISRMAWAVGQTAFIPRIRECTSQAKTRRTILVQNR
jgi:23S rRNA G2445 N2-methylase RlmL